MKNREDVCVIIQARLGSQRVQQKMIRPFSGTTLLDIALSKIKKCRSFEIEDFFLSAWEKELKDIGRNHGVNIFERSENSANSEGTPMAEMYEWWNKLSYKYCVLINACTPFLNYETIDRFFESYLSSNSEGMFAVVGKRNYYWNNSSELMIPLTEAVMNTKTAPVTYGAAHCLYAGPMSKIGENIWMGDFRTPGAIELFPVDERESFDIDYEWQFTLYEKLWNSL